MDPFEFAQAIAMAVSLLFASRDEPAPPPPPTAEVVEQATYTITTGEDEGVTVIVNPFDLEWDETTDIEGQEFSLGWIVSPVSGRLVCVTASPCEQDAHYRGAEDSSWNWVTGVEN